MSNTHATSTRSALHHCHGIWGAGVSDGSMKFQLLAIPCVIKFFVFDPGVSCLLLASMEPWWTGLSACKPNKISDPLQLWIELNSKERLKFIESGLDFLKVL
jgi:hypothetical protein